MTEILASAAIISVLMSGALQPMYEDTSPEPIVLEMEATAYCTGSITASGKTVREGYCSMARQYMGMTAVIYDAETMEYIGTYEIEDTGGDSRIKQGKVVDIYNPSYDWCIDFGRKKVKAYIYEADG
jgi:3D (Asp-Asp-Asp) domain-containing protein